jgi:hypothetical protein
MIKMTNLEKKIILKMVTKDLLILEKNKIFIVLIVEKRDIL